MKQEMQLFDSTENPSPNIIKLCDALKAIPPSLIAICDPFPAVVGGNRIQTRNCRHAESVQRYGLERAFRSSVVPGTLPELVFHISQLTQVETDGYVRLVL
ncbi:hypothetical protein TNCV_1201591 [Trichonephila clavipes]|nr:hypothetical protein TNCV_1201591 [Trichonephila clavipes]